MKERKNHRAMKHSVKDIPEEDVMETLNRYCLNTCVRV